MLMGWGPFIFTVPTFSVDGMSRALTSRVEPQPVIGMAPPLHLLGANNATITLRSTFYPHHLNGGGLAQLAAIRSAIEAGQALPLAAANGAVPNIFGMWVGTSVESGEESFDAAGTPQTVNATLTLVQEGGAFAAARSIATGLVSRVGSSLGL